MDATRILSHVESLEDNIDDLEEHLQPILKTALSATTKKLPLLDQAKLHVLIVYSIESLLFSYLRLNGVQAKEHPVFTELTRVKQYFEKLAKAENGQLEVKPTMSLNKQAAGRFIRHGLAGNERYDLERSQREAREKISAKRKLFELEQVPTPPAAPQEEPQETSQPQEAEDVSGSEEGEIGEDNPMSSSQLPSTPTLVQDAPLPSQLALLPPPKTHSMNKKQRKANKKEAIKHKKERQKKRREQSAPDMQK